MLKLKIICIILIILCLLDSTLTKKKINYCRKNLCKGKPHIACNNNGKFHANCAPNAKVIKLSRKLRASIVRKHNSLRNRIANGGINGFKSAKRMATMRWSKELAKLAALNVKQCTMRHDKCRNTPRFRFSGQNLAQHQWTGRSQSVKAIALKQIQLWFKEWTHCSMRIINKFPNGGNIDRFGHFTALMQEKNTNVGCAILRQKRNGRTTQLMACNYAYTNIAGKAVYRKGRTGSKCRTGRNRQFKALCSPKEKYNLKVGHY